MHRVAALALLFLAALPARVWPADQADGREDGFITAYAYAAMPNAARLRLDPRDDAQDVLALAPFLRERLQRRGHAVDGAANLALSFGLGLDDDLSLSDRGAAAPGDSLTVHIDAPETRLRRDQRDLNRYRLSLAIDDRGSGRRIWSAEAVFAADYRASVPIARAVAGVMLESLGRSVSRLSLIFD